jgi:maltooligosyltrehalose trehalohydrolase
LHAVLTGERKGYYQDFEGLANLAKVLTQGLFYDGCYSAYRRRCFGRPARDLSGHRFVGCLQNHDQVGNRAKGERTSHLASQGLLKVGAALVFTSPFIPMIFQGEEWGASTPFQYFTDHQDPNLAQAVREGRQREFAAFGWKPEDIPNPQARETFEQSKLDWEERSREPHRSLLEWHRDLIKLRRCVPALADARLDRIRIALDEGKRWLTVERGPVLVACNLSGSPQQVPLPLEKVGRILLKSAERISLDCGNVNLPSHSVAILSSNDT